MPSSSDESSSRECYEHMTIPPIRALYPKVPKQASNISDAKARFPEYKRQLDKHNRQRKRHSRAIKEAIGMRDRAFLNGDHEEVEAIQKVIDAEADPQLACISPSPSNVQLACKPPSNQAPPSKLQASLRQA